MLNKETSGIGPMIDKLTSIQREESFYRHGYAIDQAGTMNLNWGQFNEDAIKSAVNNKLSKISAADLLEEARPEFLNQIRNEISLSTIRGDSYVKLSQRIEQILGVSVVGGKDAIYKGVGIAARALRIARTEGQRALIEGQLASYQRAEDIGCEIEEIWDATLDGKTRPEHGELDGQAKDTEKGGWLVPNIGIVTGPLQSGVASFDINCRCRVRGQVIGYPAEKRAYRDKDGKTQVGKYETYKEWKSKQEKTIIPTQKKTKTKGVTKKQTINRNYHSQYAKMIGKEHYDNAHDIIDKCNNEKLKSIWEKYESQIKIADVKYKGTAHYSPYYDHIKLDINKTANGNKYSSKYQTLFHETGHAIDNKIAMSNKSIINKAIGYSNSYKNGLFPDTIEKEINDILLKYEKEIKKEILDHITDYKWLHENKYIDIFEYNNWVKNGIKPRKPRYKQKYAFSKLGNEIRAIPLDEVGNISDIIEGGTYGKVNVHIGHGSSYWKKKKRYLYWQKYWIR